MSDWATLSVLTAGDSRRVAVAVARDLGRIRAERQSIRAHEAEQAESSVENLKRLVGWSGCSATILALASILQYFAVTKLLKTDNMM